MKPYADEVMADAPVGYWRMDEPSGTTMFDNSGGARHGTYSGATLNQGTGIGPPGAAVYFNGTSAYASVPDSAAFALTGAVTLECWVLGIAPYNSASFVNRRDAANVGGYILEANPSIVSFYVYTTTWVAVSCAAPTPNRWHHVVGVYTSGRHEIWVDGLLAGSAATTGAINNPAAPDIWFGRNRGNGALYYGGLLDEAAIYGTALSGARIRAHFLAGTPYSRYKAAVLAEQPVGYWRLGETGGTFCADDSGNNRDGTATNATRNQPGALLTDADPATSFPLASSAYVTVPDNRAFDLTGDMTIEAWVKLTSYSNHILLCNKCVGGGSTNSTFEAQIRPEGYMQFVQCNAGGQQVLNSSVSGVPVGLGAWAHLAYVKDGATVRFYRNGTQLATGAIATTGVTTGTSPLYIGTRDDRYSYADGLIDEVAVYPKALPAQRIALHYALAQSLYAGEVVVDAPLLYWRFGGDTAGQATDYSGNNRQGTYSAGITGGAPSCLAGDPNTSNLFNGTSGYLNRAWDAGMLLGSGPGTLEAWVRLDSGFSGNPRIIAWGANMAWQLYIDGSRQLKVFLFNGGEVGTAYTLQYGQTYHLVASIGAQGAGNLVIYANGSAIYTAANVGGTNSNSGMALQVGQSGNNADWWKGLIDEVAIYNTALPAARVLAHFQAGAGYLQRYGGSAWAPTAVRRWDGTQWVPALAKRWDGAAWV